jgi:hypothetical protein
VFRRSKYEPFIDLSLSIEKKRPDPLSEIPLESPTEDFPVEPTSQGRGRAKPKARVAKKRGPLQEGVSLVDCLSGFTSLENLQHSVVSQSLSLSDG